MTEETRSCELDRPFFMVDLETLATTPNAAILSIGATAFNPRKDVITSDFFMWVDFGSCLDIGGYIDPKTLRWWMNQIKDSTKPGDKPDISVFEGIVPIEQVLDAFSEWLFDQETDYEKRVIFGNGSDFDNMILAHYYKRLGKPLPWPYFGNRCYRSLKNMYPDVKMMEENTHHALDDVINQTMHLMAIANHAKVKSL